jgi:hypothetical protein
MLYITQANPNGSANYNYKREKNRILNCNRAFCDPNGDKLQLQTQLAFCKPQPYPSKRAKRKLRFAFFFLKCKTQPHHLITHATHSATSCNQPLTMGNAFSISLMVFHITVISNSILVIKWSSCLISIVDLALKNGINVISSPLPTPQKSLFLHG